MRMTSRLRLPLLGLVVLLPTLVAGQQLPDRDFNPPITAPTAAEGAGPRLCLDEAHHNFHTLDNRFFAFGQLARRDGYRVTALRETFTASSFATCDILVISNAQNGIPWPEQPRPTPSAFTAAEIAEARSWVERGGALLLIADHQPLAGAAKELAAAFGAEFIDGFAYARSEAEAILAKRDGSFGPTLFRRNDSTLVATHPIARGRSAQDELTQLRSFTGQAFRWNASGVQPLMRLPADYVSLEPRFAWNFDSTTVTRPVGGWLQGATLQLGRGRVAMFGEAAMFSAQIAGSERRPMGMNAPGAEQNPRLVLNTLRWLSGRD